MYAGVQGIGTSKTELEFLRRHGVTHMDTTIDPDDPRPDRQAAGGGGCRGGGSSR